jgi:hypothetical protein
MNQNHLAEHPSWFRLLLMVSMGFDMTQPANSYDVGQTIVLFGLPALFCPFLLETKILKPTSASYCRKPGS